MRVCSVAISAKGGHRNNEHSTGATAPRLSLRSGALLVHVSDPHDLSHAIQHVRGAQRAPPLLGGSAEAARTSLAQRIRGLRGVMCHARRILAPASSKMLAHIHSAYNLLRHMLAGELQSLARCIACELVDVVPADGAQRAEGQKQRADVDMRHDEMMKPSSDQHSRLQQAMKQFADFGSHSEHMTQQGSNQELRLQQIMKQCADSDSRQDMMMFMMMRRCSDQDLRLQQAVKQCEDFGSQYERMMKHSSEQDLRLQRSVKQCSEHDSCCELLVRRCSEQDKRLQQFMQHCAALEVRLG